MKAKITFVTSLFVFSVSLFILFNNTTMGYHPGPEATIITSANECDSECDIADKVFAAVGRVVFPDKIYLTKS